MMIVLLVALVCWNPTIDSLVVPIKPQLPKGQLSKQTKSLRDARSLLSFRHQVVAPRSDEDQMDGIPRRPSYFSLPEILTPPKIDTQAVLWITGSQGVVFLTAVFCQILFFGKSIDQTTMLSFDRDSIVLALQISVITVIAGVVFDKLPNEQVQRIVRDTRVYTLRIIGRNTSYLVAFIVATLLSLSAGVSEELLFRGFLLVWFKQYFGTPLSVLMSSAVFGLAHYPVFGASALVEATLGGIFAFSYVYSGYNLAVPIAIHTLYDLFTIYYTWVGASKDIKSRIKEANENLESKSDKQLLRDMPMLPKEVVSSEIAVFQFLDANKDGFIDKQEYDAGLKLLGFSPVQPYAPRSSWQDELFAEMDKNKDGKITFEEFNAATTEGVRRWMSLR